MILKLKSPATVTVSTCFFWLQSCQLSTVTQMLDQLILEILILDVMFVKFLRL